MKKYIPFLISILLLINTSCMQYDDLYLEEYHKILSIKTDNPIQDVTLYSTGEDAQYSFTVLKGGTNPELPSEASLSVLTEQELEAYNKDNNLSFSLLPSNCFSFSNKVIQFSKESDRYQTVKVILKTELIKDYLNSNSNKREYVIPIILRGATAGDVVNPDLNILILRPEVVTPSIAFDNPKSMSAFCGKLGTNIEIPIVMPIENKWDFSCTVDLDNSVHSEKNILPSSLYQLENDGKVTFIPGTNKAILRVKLNPLANIEDEFILPLKIVSSTNANFHIDDQPFIVRLSNKMNITSAMLYTNAPEQYEGSLAYLLDNDVSTYFHSAWSVVINEKHYIQVTLPTTITQFKFSYTNRQSNAATAVSKLFVSESTDGYTFTEIKTFMGDVDGLPYTTPAGVYKSPVLNIKENTKYLRFTCLESTSGSDFFVWSEFALWGL